MVWTVRHGATQLCEDYPDAVQLLCRILCADITSSELAQNTKYINLMHHIGGNPALKALRDSSGTRLAHWPRVWAARTLAHIGDLTCSDALIKATSDREWRVRMQTIRAAGLISDPITVQAIAERLISDPHPRVRQALALAIARKSNAQSEMLLGRLSSDPEVSVRRAAERASTNNRQKMAR